MANVHIYQGIITPNSINRNFIITILLNIETNITYSNFGISNKSKFPNRKELHQTIKKQRSLSTLDQIIILSVVEVSDEDYKEYFKIKDITPETKVIKKSKKSKLKKIKKKY